MEKLLLDQILHQLIIGEINKQKASNLILVLFSVNSSVISNGNGDYRDRPVEPK